jgi:hypothetical protein
MEVISIEFSQRREGLATFRLKSMFILEAIKHSLQNPRCSGRGVQALSQHLSRMSLLAAPITRHISQRCRLPTVLLQASVPRL